ncbi:hypothetical protein TNCT_285391 [Trichonephila clavata]|uniref:Rho-GAP domain-containing protein n=1 Tax=Trichonephila clavata TaxID=2740835 RepID=A0A8X6LJX9_TRICU|nr:hypothetical protein TNCT_285391 [Trichonephila clavata]
MYHLKKVVEHSATNKMEARNLAIVFGPTLVRTTDNNMVAMVTDMPQQCYLIETMIAYAEWLFEDCGDILPMEINAQDKRKTHPPSNIQSNALLSNINKLDEESLPHEMFTSFCTHTMQPLAVDTENLSDLSFGSCSSLISGSSKSKQRSVSKELTPQNDSLVAEGQSSESSHETSGSLPHPEEELVGHRTGGFIGLLADDPSYLSCLLSRGVQSTELSPPTEFTTDPFRNKSGIPSSSSSSAVKEITSSSIMKSPKCDVPILSESQQQNNRFTVKDKFSNQHGSESLRTKFDKSDIPTSVSQPILSSVLCDKTTGSVHKDYSLNSATSKPNVFQILLTQNPLSLKMNLELVLLRRIVLKKHFKLF